MPISAGKVILPEYKPVWSVQFLDMQSIYGAVQKIQERFPASIEQVSGEPGEYRILIDAPNQSESVYLEIGNLMISDQTAQIIWIMFYAQEDGLFTIKQYNLQDPPKVPYGI